MLWGRSHCTDCRHTIRWHDLVPVASFLILGGKCRDCHSQISFQYPIVEGVTGALFLLTYYYYSHSLFLHSPFAGFLSPPQGVLYLFGFLFYCAAIFLLAGIAVYDARTRLIAPAFLLPFFALGLLGLFFRWLGGDALWPVGSTLGAALLVFLFFAAIWFFSRGAAMGFGDAELAAGIVVFFGALQGLLGIILSFWMGAAVGIAAVLLGKARMKSVLPFGPFLVLGALVSFFWGDQIISRYLAIF